MRFVLAVLALTFVTGAQAQAAAQAIDDPQANVVEELVVSAKLPGPAWWRVSDADTTIYVLGMPVAVPKGMAWDKSVVERRLDGAFTILTPPEWRAGLTDIPALLKLRKTLKDDGEWAARDPALAARTQRAWAAADPKKPDGWKDWKPLFIAMQLGGKADRAAGLLMSEPDRTIDALAKKRRVKGRSAKVGKAMPMLKSLARQHTDEAGRVCLTETLETVEAGPAARRAAAEAWARGDVKAVLAAPRSTERCQLLLPGVPELMRQSVEDEADALVDLLKTPGHAVALYPIRGLVAEKGVLNKLRARGITVRTPGEG
uniref:TraB/GumN family protein n=1 Tax=uncultured Caulobacter sp. TaxID=158749 RepID=UPI0025F15B3F|nr:TraB/GumN family protein [uncultured Caulobacter sp.]